MGSGSSKSKTVKLVQNVKTEPRLAVANENNNNSNALHSSTRQNIVIGLRSENDSSKLLWKSSDDNVIQRNEHSVLGKDVNYSKRNEEKNKQSLKQQKWESDTDSILDDPWDEFLGPTRSSNVPHQTNARRGMQEREKELNDKNTQKTEENYPETYAQRLTREQYKLDQAKLLRQKTIYRDTDEWKLDQEDELEKRKSKGFDASKFRAVNVATEKADVFSSTTQDLQTPRYITDMDQDSHTTSNETSEVKKHLEFPTYSQEEEELMMMLENQFTHQTMSTATMH